MKFPFLLLAQALLLLLFKGSCHETSDVGTRPGPQGCGHMYYYLSLFKIVFHQFFSVSRAVKIQLSKMGLIGEFTFAL